MTAPADIWLYVPVDAKVTDLNTLPLAFQMFHDYTELMPDPVRVTDEMLVTEPGLFNEKVM